MCGIAGIIGFNNCTSNLNDMLVSMNHRGPDDRGIFIEESVALGHNRLSIIDLSQAGHQPMTNQDGNLTIVFNGEIYNYQELRELLPSNTVLKSSTDTEVILELWSIYGTGIHAKLRGMFAFAILDHSTKKLVLARDHMGIKPLYYWRDGDKLVFASEIKGMLASGLIKRNICNDGLSQYLENGYILQPSTIIENIFMLPPASYLILENNKVNIQTFWNITDKLNLNPKTEQEAIQTVKSILTNAVKEETISDRPLGVFLSGGLDSTVLVAALKNCGVDNIKTFSVGFDGDELSEEVDAKETAAFYNTKHTQLQVGENDIIPHINQFIQALDQPSVDGLNTWLVSKVTSNQVTVALSGLGADELFSGYSIDSSIIHKQKFKIPSTLIKWTRFIWKYVPIKLNNKLSTYASWSDLPSFYQSWGMVFKPEEVKILTGRQSKQNVFVNFDILKKFTILQRITFMHLRTFMMSRLLRDSDAVSMDSSIEVRFPMIDFRLVNFCFHLPDKWKIKFINETVALKNYEKQNSFEQHGVKHILYQAFKNDLPPGFGKRAKRGFKMPIEKWMRIGLEKDIESVFNSNTSLLSSTKLKEIHKNWLDKKINYNKVWAIYILEKWVKQNIK